METTKRYETETVFSNETIVWSVIDLTLLLITVAGNALTLCAIILSKKVSGLLSNRFVFSLALSDLMVGLTIPYHFAFSVGYTLSENRKTCILRFVLVIFACSSSIYNLLAIATDRYLAIVHPLRYGRYMQKRIAYAVIVFGWCVTLFVATVVIYWNRWAKGKECSLNHVVPAEYLTYVLIPMFISVWFVMLLIYIKIWRVANKHAKRLRDVTKSRNGTMLPKDWKSVKVVMLILGCFSICWMPYFATIAYIRIFGHIPTLLYEITFTLAMANSSMNPVIYAWKNSNFRKSFWCMLRCKSPNSLVEKPQYVTNHVPTIDRNLARKELDENNVTIYSKLTFEIDDETNDDRKSDTTSADTISR